MAYAQDVHVTGVDANPAMQSYCQAAADAAGLPRGRLDLVIGDAAALPFPDASFDAVVCTLVLALQNPLLRTRCAQA